MEGNTNNYLSPDCRFGKLYSSEGKVHYYSQNIANSKVSMFGIKYSPVPFHLCLETQGETTGEPFSSKGQVRSETLSCATFHAVGRAGKKWHIHDLCRCSVPDWSVQRALDVYCTTWAGNRKEEGISPWRFPRCRNKKSPYSLTCIQVTREL